MDCSYSTFKRSFSAGFSCRITCGDWIVLILGLGMMGFINNILKDIAGIEERVGIIDLHKILTTFSYG